MAHVANRSRFLVTVRNRPDLSKHFSFNQFGALEAFMQALRKQGFKPKATQLDESWLVRIRDKGYKPVEGTFESEAAATQFLDKVTEERRRGLFIDYTAALKVTFAELIVRYLLEEAGRSKSGPIVAYTLEGWLEDSGPRGMELLERYREKRRAEGNDVRVPRFKMRQPSEELSWIHKHLAEITTVDIEEFIKERLEVVESSTVDREIDRLKAIFKVTLTVWGYHLARNPMDAVRRPKFFNERDRRISADEEARLLDELKRQDIERAVETRLRDLADQALVGQTFTSRSARKKALAKVRANLRQRAEDEAEVIPYLQAFLVFQLMTAARRGETMTLTWDRVDFAAKTALLPETKNGRARKLALRRHLLDVLELLPRNTNRVFAVGLDYIVDSWNKACRAAGIEDLRIHDCRHEAISRVAESGKFTIPELQVFSGHKDVRMLMRYAHLCASRLASKLDESFADDTMVRVHRGRKLLNKHAAVKVADLLNAASTTEAAPTAIGNAPNVGRVKPGNPTSGVALVTEATRQDGTTNVIAFRPHLRA